MTTHKESVAAVMELFNAEYPGKFQAGVERLRFWSQMLREFEPEVILGAAYHLASICQWPPSIAEMRERCVMISIGQLDKPTGAESWERILRKMGAEPDLELRDTEIRALKQTSSIFNLKQSSNPSTDRAHYIRAFDQIVHKEHMDRVTLPEVKRLTAKHEPRGLPDKDDMTQTAKQLAAKQLEGTVMSYSEAREQFADDIKALEKMLKIEMVTEYE